MYQVIIVIHVLLGLSIIGLILMQQGKGADAGAAFGAGASGSVFGAQGAASFLSRTTAILATLFFITSLGLAVLNGHKDGTSYDLMSEQPAAEQDTLAIPEVEGAKPVESTSDTPAVAPTEQPAAVVDTVVPKADEIKKVEIKNTTVPDTAKKAEKK